MSNEEIGLQGSQRLNCNEIGILIAALTLLFTILSTYITFKGYSTRKRGKPKGTKDKERHNKSNRDSLNKITVAFIIKVTKK